MTNKAPTGGMTSAVNGQFYEGGEFMPDHGHYCGRGKNRVTRVAFDVVAEMVRADGKELVYDERYGEFRVLYQTGNVMYRARALATIAKCF
jgi:hypothetical protein